MFLSGRGTENSDNADKAPVERIIPALHVQLILFKELQKLSFTII